SVTVGSNIDSVHLPLIRRCCSSVNRCSSKCHRRSLAHWILISNNRYRWCYTGCCDLYCIAGSSSWISTRIIACHHYCYCIIVCKCCCGKGYSCLTCYRVAIDHPLVSGVGSSIGRCCSEGDTLTCTDRRTCRYDRYRWCNSSDIHHYLVTRRCRCGQAIGIACHDHSHYVSICKCTA